MRYINPRTHSVTRSLADCRLLPAVKVAAAAASGHWSSASLLPHRSIVPRVPSLEGELKRP